MTLSKVISLSDDDHYTAWQVPNLRDDRSDTVVSDIRHDTNGFGNQEDSSAPNEMLSDEQSKDFFEDGYKKGYEEGRKQTSGSHDVEKKQLHDIVQAMSNPLEQLNESVEAELVELALAVAKMILRREIAEDQRHIVGLIREAVKQLPSATVSIRVHLHPDDARVVTEALAETGKTAHWQIDEDPAMRRGDCQIHTENSFIDAGIDGLIARLAADMIGNQRSTDMNENQANVINQSG